MNSFRRKNIVLKNSEIEDIPYGNARNVQIPLAEIPDTPDLYCEDLDNAFHQLVDNDLYNQNRIAGMVANTDGAVMMDPSEVARKGDGFKYAHDDGDDELNFYAKRSRPLSATVSRIPVDGDLDTDVRFIESVAGTIFVGTGTKTRFFRAAKVPEESIQMSAVTFGGGEVSLSGAYPYSEGMFFGGRDGIYEVTSESCMYAISSIGLEKMRFNGGHIDVQNVIQVVEGNQGEALFALYGDESGYSLLSSRSPSDSVAYRMVFASGVVAYGFQLLDPALDQTVSSDNKFLFATNMGLYRSTGVANHPLGGMGMWTEKLSGTSDPIYKIELDSPGRYLLYEPDGLYVYESSQNLQYKLSPSPDQVVAVDRIESRSRPTEYFELGNGFVGKSANLRSSETLIQFSKVEQLSDLQTTNCIYVADDRNMFVGTPVGLYRTRDLYDISCESTRFDMDDVSQMFEDTQDYIDERISARLSAHVDESHVLSGTYQQINDTYLAVDFSNLCAFTGVQDPDLNPWYAICDVMRTTRIGDQHDGEIMAMVRNFATGNEWTPVEVRFVSKLWDSRFNEFDIYLPTTNTYYLNHNPGTPNCTDRPGDVIKRANLYTAKLRNVKVDDRLSSTLSSYYTDIRLFILSGRYDIQSVVGTDINGSSLPLYIYKDNSQEIDDFGSGLMYHSFIEPSMFIGDTNVLSTDEMGYYVFHACCFGTDAQSIAIRTMTTTTDYYGDENVLSVVYHGNGGRTKFDMPTFTQIVRLDPGTGDVLPGQLYLGEIFRYESEIFLGWSETLLEDDPDDSDISKMPTVEIAKEDFRGRRFLNLYAAWLHVDWSKSHTEFIIDIGAQDR